MKVRHDRDQERTAFAHILERLTRSVGAVCAALVDREGETVDYAGHRIDPFEIRIAAAELRLLAQHLNEQPHLGSSYELVVRAKKKSFVVRTLPEGYALVVELGRRSSQISSRPLSVAVRELCAEAGFEPEAPRGGTGAESAWLRVEVTEQSRASHRPCAIRGGDAGSVSLEVLGRLPGYGHEQRRAGFRIRLESGQEGTLVREAFGNWYLEQDP